MAFFVFTIGIVFTRNALLWADGSESGWNLLGFGVFGALSGFVVDRD